MINLLPPDIKEDYRFARRNSRLVSWVFAFGFAIVGLAALSVGGMFYLDQTARSFDKQVEGLQTNLKQQNQAQIKKEVKEIDGNLKLAVQVLGKQVLYSKMLTQLATVIPSNAALANLNINQLQGALDITAETADYNAATQLQVNLSDAKNKIFSKADIVSISCTAPATGESAKRYPCTVTIRALFAKDNPYLFITNGNKAAAPTTAPAATGAKP